MSPMLAAAPRQDLDWSLARFPRKRERGDIAQSSASAPSGSGFIPQ